MVSHEGVHAHDEWAPSPESSFPHTTTRPSAPNAAQFLATETSHSACGERCISPRPLPHLSACRTVGVHRAITHWFVDDNVAVANLHVIQTIRVGADPRLKLDRGALASKIRQRHQITCTTLATSRKSELHARYPFLQFRRSPHSYTEATRETATTLSLTGAWQYAQSHCTISCREFAVPNPDKLNGFRCGARLKMRNSSNF